MPAYYLLTVIISWAGWLPVVAASHDVAAFRHPAWQAALLLPMCGPAVAALLTARWADGPGAESALLARFNPRGVAGYWFSAALLIPLTLGLTAWAADQALPELRGSYIIPARAAAPVLAGGLFSALAANPLEELGWRGFALARLQRRMPDWAASLIVGLMWAVWHLPLFAWRGHPMAGYPIIPWLVGLLAGSFIYTWLYRYTNGSLFITSLYHVTLNTAFAMLPSSIMAMAVVQALLAALIFVADHGATARLYRN